MLRRLSLLALLFASTGHAQEVSLQGIWSQRLVLEDLFETSTKATVFFIAGTECSATMKPLIPELTQLEAEYRPRGIRFVALYPDADTDAYQMGWHGQELDIPFWLLRDEGQVITHLLNATNGGEVLVTDRNLNVLYRGATVGTGSPLRTALEKIASGQPVSTSQTPFSGCRIDPAASHAPRTVTYARDVAPIMRKRCEPCHRQGQPVPFTLDTYAVAFDKRARVKDMVETRRMPPWPGRHNAQAFGPIVDAGWLTEEERQTILDWIAGGAPEGNTSQLPPAATWPTSGGWTIGRPEKVFEMPLTFQVPATGLLPYQFYRIKVDAPEDRWIRAIETQPGTAAVVHHIQAHIIKSDDSPMSGTQAMLALYGLAGNAKLFGGYVPGDNFNGKTYSADEAVRLPAHTDLILEVHYMPNGRPATDKSRLGIVYADGPPQREIMTKAFVKARGRFFIPPDDPHVVFEDEYFFEKDVRLIGIKPHMHLRGKSYLVEMEHADGRVETILRIPAWDFNWQRTYEFETPIRVPTTAVIRSRAVYDNSLYNPFNPDPTKTVGYGLQSEDEMYNCRFIYYEEESR